MDKILYLYKEFGEYLHDIGLGKYFGNRIQLSRTIKEYIVKRNPSKLKGFVL